MHLGLWRRNKKGEFGPASIIRRGQFGCHREKNSRKARGQRRSRAARIKPILLHLHHGSDKDAPTLAGVREQKLPFPPTEDWQMLLSLHMLLAAVHREPLSATNSINIGDRVAEYYFGLATTAIKSVWKPIRVKASSTGGRYDESADAELKDWDLRSCSSVRGRNSKEFHVDTNNKGKWRRRNGSTCFCRNLNGT